MDYIKASEAARKWGVHLRVAQQYCKEGRVEGAKKYGASWMIPAEAEKPRDPRRKLSSCTPPPYINCILLSSVVPMPDGDPEAALDALPDEIQKAQYAAELAYMRGDFAAVKAYYERVSPEQSTYLCACDIAICAAMCTRDYSLFKRISASIKNIEHSAADRQTARMAELLSVHAAVCMHAPELVPDWLIKGDFSEFPPETLPMLIFIRVKYMQIVNDQCGLLAAAQTALSVYGHPGAVTLVDVYLTTLCACACYALKRLDEAREYLGRNVSVCEKCGFVAPLGEYSTWLGGLMELALKKCAPDFEKAVLLHIESTLYNWLFFHNEFTHDNISLILTTKEYQLAHLLMEGKTYKQAAQRLLISEGSTRNLVSVIYEKLGISKKADLKRFIY